MYAYTHTDTLVRMHMHKHMHMRTHTVASFFMWPCSMPLQVQKDQDQKYKTRLGMRIATYSRIHGMASVFSMRSDVSFGRGYSEYKTKAVANTQYLQ